MTGQDRLLYSLKKGYAKGKLRSWAVIIILSALTAALGILLLTIGNTDYSLREVINILGSPGVSGAAYTIKKLRIPKLVIGLLAGYAFGSSGYTFQTLLRNPLASPDIIGITAGSSAAAVFCILILKISGAIVSFYSIIAGLAVTFLIFYLSGRFSSSAGNRMIIIGIGVQAILNALISWMLLIGSEFDVATALRWLRGSLNDCQLSDIPAALAIVVIAGGGLLFLQRDLLMMQLGEEYPLTLGVRTETVRIASMVFALLLVAGASAVTGPIASVAFLSGPIASRLVGKGRGAMLASGMVGIVLVYAAELLGQNGFSTRYPVGVITGVLGAPYLLILLTRINKRGVTR